jgi:hypothetical protein
VDVEAGHRIEHSGFWTASRIAQGVGELQVGQANKRYGEPAGSNPARPDSDCGELIEIFEELKGAGYGRISRHPGRSGWVGVGADY